MAVEVVDGRLVDRCFETEFVTFAVAHAGLHAGTCQKTCEGIRIVISTGAVGLQERHATKFRRPDNKRMFQQSSLFHVGDQSSRGLNDGKPSIVKPVFMKFSPCG